MRDDGRIILFRDDFRHILLAHIGEVQGRDAAGIGPGREDAVGVDEQGIPFQEKAHGRIGVLEGLEHRIVRILLAAVIPLPIIDGSGHVTQGGEIPAPLYEGGIAFVPTPESTAVEHHQQRPGDRTSVMRDIQVHLQVRHRPVVVQIPDHASIDDVVRLPDRVRGLPIELPGRKQVEFREFVGLQDRFLGLEVEAEGIRPQGTRIPVHQGFLVAQGVQVNAYIPAMDGIQTRFDGSRTGKSQAEDGQESDQASSVHLPNSRFMSRSIAGFTSFSGTNSQCPMTEAFPMTSGSMEPFSIR